MLVASKKKNKEILFPTIDYQNETLNGKGESHKIVSKVGFFEIEKRKVLGVNNRTGETKFGDVIKEEFVSTEDEFGFKKVGYSGKTLIISIQNSRFTTSTRPATEEDKERYKEAYEAFLELKKETELKEKELKEAKEAKDKLEEKLALIEKNQKTKKEY